MWRRCWPDDRSDDRWVGPRAVPDQKIPLESLPRHALHCAIEINLREEGEVAMDVSVQNNTWSTLCNQHHNSYVNKAGAAPFATNVRNLAAERRMRYLGTADDVYEEPVIDIRELEED